MPLLTLLIPIALSVLAGASIVVQQALIANLRIALNSAAWAGFMSYFVGLLCMIVLALALRDPLPTLSVATRIPWWAWCGGAFGAIFIALATILVPLLGAGTLPGAARHGQMLASVAFDHFGWLGLAQRALDGRAPSAWCCSSPASS